MIKYTPKSKIEKEQLRKVAILEAENERLKAENAQLRADADYLLMINDEEVIADEQV